jgi:hypothetical protein
MTIPKGYRQIDIKNLNELDKSKEYKLASQELSYDTIAHHWMTTYTAGGAVQADIDAGCPVYEKIPEYREVLRVVKFGANNYVNVPNIPISAKVLVIYPVPEGEE